MSPATRSGLTEKQRTLLILYLGGVDEAFDEVPTKELMERAELAEWIAHHMVVVARMNGEVSDE